MKTYDEMLKYVEKYLVDHNGIRHSNPQLSFRNRFWHTRRVFEWTKIVAEDYPNCNIQALYTAAIFHDIGYARGKDDHAENGEKIFLEYASAEGLDKKFSEYVSYLIKFHSTTCLLENPDTPIELILLQEADLLDEEGAMGIIFDALAYSKRNPNNASFYGLLQEIYKHSSHILEQDFMVTPIAKKIWKEKQDFVREFIKEYSRDLFEGIE